MTELTDWHAWHDRYVDPDSSLSRRLAVVRRRIDEALSRGGVETVLSLCAGDGRDVIPVLATRAVGERPQVTLVELDRVLAESARQRAAQVAVDVTVIAGDAGLRRTWGDVPPVDLLLLCGIFGNISHDDIRTTIQSVPALLHDGGTVIWTRGNRGDGVDLRPQVRQWFADAGFEEVGYDEEAIGYGVAVHRRTDQAPLAGVPERLFSFVR